MAKNFRRYSIRYKMYEADVETVHSVGVCANTIAEAYEKAVYEEIPKWNGGALPYSAWVTDVTYCSGAYKLLNNFEGKPY